MTNQDIADKIYSSYSVVSGENNKEEAKKQLHLLQIYKIL